MLQFIDKYRNIIILYQFKSILSMPKNILWIVLAAWISTTGGNISNVHADEVIMTSSKNIRWCEGNYFQEQTPEWKQAIIDQNRNIVLWKLQELQILKGKWDIRDNDELVNSQLYRWYEWLKSILGKYTDSCLWLNISSAKRQLAEIIPESEYTTLEIALNYQELNKNLEDIKTKSIDDWWIMLSYRDASISMQELERITWKKVVLWLQEKINLLEKTKQRIQFEITNFFEYSQSGRWKDRARSTDTMSANDFGYTIHMWDCYRVILTNVWTKEDIVHFDNHRKTFIPEVKKYMQLWDDINTNARKEE